MIEVKYSQAAAGLEAPLKKKKYRDYDIRLRNVVDNYEFEKMDEFLKNVANLVLL